MSKEKELLRKQMELLAEQSVDALGGATSSRSEAMCKVYKTLVADKLILLVSLCVVLGLDLTVYGAIKIEKLLRRKG